MTDAEKQWQYLAVHFLVIELKTVMTMVCGDSITVQSISTKQNKIIIRTWIYKREKCTL